MTIDLLYEKCDHCHLFVGPDDNCSSTGDGCTCGWRSSLEGDAYSEAYVAHLPAAQYYVHFHRGDAADTTLDESHQAVPSGRKANLLTWKTYGPLAMRERFDS